LSGTRASAVNTEIEYRLPSARTNLKNLGVVTNSSLGVLGADRVRPLGDIDGADLQGSGKRAASEGATSETSLAQWRAGQQGLLITTCTFSKDPRAEATRDGTHPINGVLLCKAPK
ncbi:MAG: hypothetical protein KDB26_14520, partial [Microthrixaceae bacterium]|nr:hypothetical protein [Microthrixaceae bacterium]